MFDIFQHSSRPNETLFFCKNDANDVRLGELIAKNNFTQSEIVILGCPQDEGVRRNGGRLGAAFAPDVIRRQFYKLTDFGINRNVFDLGDTILQPTLEETHDLHTKIVEEILRAGKRLIVLGGGNDVSYPDGAATAKTFGRENWSALNIDQHFDVRTDFPRNSGTPYRQLLEENHLKPENFYEIAYQSATASRVYYDYLKNLEVNLTSLEDFQFSKNGFYDLLYEKLRAEQHPIFWGFDVDAVRASDAPGVSASSPLGLSAEQFCRLAKTAGSLPNTKIVEFTEVNPNFDIDNRTAKLTAMAMHEFIRAAQ